MSGGGQRQYQQQHMLHHTHQPPHTKAATIGVSGGNYYKRYGVGNNGGGVTNTSTLGYSKVSFSDGEDTTPYAQKQQQQHQQQRFAPTRASGSYVRFSDDQSAAGLTYDDHAQDIVSTFGTLPRGQDYPRRRIIHDNDADFFVPPSKPQQPSHVQTVGNVGALKRTPSPLCPPQGQSEMGDLGPGVVTYASVHKRSSSPGFRTAEYGRIIQQQPPTHAIVPGVGDTQTDSQNVSRVSSYANIPTSSKQSWDASSLTKVDAARPPTGRPIPHPGNGHQQPQQYHHHQHHYSIAGSASSSPQPYATLPHPTSIGNVPPGGNGGTPNNNGRRHQVGYKPVSGAETVALQPRASPKHSPSLEPEGYHNGLNGQARKLTSFSNSSSASGGVGAGESTDTTPTQQTFGGLLAPGAGGPMTTSASSSSREMTPLSNASGSLNRPPGSNKAGVSLHQQPVGSNWHSNPVYGAPAAINRSYTPQSSNYGSITPTTPGSSAGVTGGNHVGDHSHQHHYGAGGGLGVVYYNGAPRPGTRPMPSVGAAAAAADGLGTSTTSSGGRTLLGLESHDRNDSANFSLTSSNESENNQFVTSIV